jgi:non-specific serine/threonine protein kinase/serine/threonine-protein kinase
MTPEELEKVGEILEQALAVQPAERSRFLEQACTGNAALRCEVESLLASHEQAGNFLNPPAIADAASAPRASVLPGRRIGAYDILEEIGRGGMGEVFAAARADGLYEKTVAIKLVRGGYDTEFILERFRNERQILASLDHPNIARLLDGGTTADHIPYLVMELVEGVPIDAYCDAHKLSVSERLRLFRQVCGAVQYAHQRLVIHRDIKPSNILVTENGTPKLLDFGIAKILDASGNTEATMLRPMTPEYASPEQVRGEPITTATDAYSLGVVLYQLLTGRSPYRVDTRTPAKLAHAITDVEPERPSTSVQRTEAVPKNGETQELTPELVSSTRELSPLRLQRRLRGDLDFILLKALRKEPDKRYSSVEQLSEDLRRHLEGLPVNARKGTWNYRAGKFIRRHRAAVAAASLVLLTLVVGVIATLREARIAEANRRRAEARFNDVRKLANSLMFEVHDSIRELPGATAARKLIVQRAQEYLDVLAKDSKSDPSLLQELAAAYAKLASVQGNSQDANLGDTSKAVQNNLKAVQLLSDCLALDSRNRDVALQLAGAYQNLALALSSTGDKSGARDSTQRALHVLEPLAAAHPEDPKLQFGLGSALEQTGTFLVDDRDLTHASEYYQRALAVLKPLSQAYPQRSEISTEVSFVHKHMGSLLGIQRQLPAALEHYRAALAIDEARLTAEPGNSQVRYNITYTYSDTGWILSQQHEYDAALVYYSKALQIRSQLAAADPNDVRAREGVSNTHDYLGWIYGAKGDDARALRSFQDALAIRQSLFQKDPANERLRVKVAASQAHIGETYARMASQAQSRPGDHFRYCREAKSWILKALPVYQQQEAQGKLVGLDVGRPAALLKVYEGCDHSSAQPAKSAQSPSH